MHFNLHVSMSLARLNNNTNVMLFTESASCLHCAVLCTIKFMFYRILQLYIFFILILIL